MKQIKSIVVIANDYPSENRPVYTFVEQLISKFVDKGIEVTVIAPQSLTHSIIHKKPILPYHTSTATKNNNKYNVLRPLFLSFGNKDGLLDKIATYTKKKMHSVCT